MAMAKPKEYAPFRSVEEYLGWYCEAKKLIESAQRHGEDYDDLLCAVCDLSIHQFLHEPYASDIVDAWERGYNLEDLDYYQALGFVLAKANIIGSQCQWLLNSREDIMPEGWADKATLSVPEVCSILGVRKETLYSYINDGRIPEDCYFRLGGSSKAGVKNARKYRFWTDKFKELLSKW